MRHVGLNCISTILISTALTSCMVGPDFHSPAAPQKPSYTRNPLPKKTMSTSGLGTAGKSQYFAIGDDIPAEWWKIFHSVELNQLIRAGLTNSPNLAAAKATLVQAQETLNAQIDSTLFPAVSGQLGGERQRFSGASFGQSGSSIFNLYNASVNVTYTLDVFGGARRQIEAVAAQVDYNQYLMHASYITLTSNIVTTTITIASLQSQIQATHELISSQTNQLVIMKKQLNVGAISEADLLSQQAQLAQTQATLPPLAQSLAVARHSLAVLVGEFPSDNSLRNFSLARITLPAKLPVSLSSSLVRQRPDIQASEALLHAASAQIGVAVSNLYPKFNLTGAYGWTNDVFGGMISSTNSFWNYGTTILQPIYNAGALQAQKRAAIAAFNAAAAQYRQTVLQAFQNVADTLRALEHDAQTLKAQRNAEIAALRSWRIIKTQYRLGGVNYINLLTAERTYQQARISRIQAEAARYSDTAALFQALGGGWWNAYG